MEFWRQSAFICEVQGEPRVPVRRASLAGGEVDVRQELRAFRRGEVPYVDGAYLEQSRAYMTCVLLEEVSELCGVIAVLVREPAFDRVINIQVAVPSGALSGGTAWCICI